MKAVANETLQIKYEILLKENEQLREKLTDTTENFRLVKYHLETEKKSNKELMTDQASFFMQRNELEQLFRKCVNEVKKDIAKRKSA